MALIYPSPVILRTHRRHILEKPNRDGEACRIQVWTVQLAVVTGKRMFARVVQTTVSRRRWRVLHETNGNLLK